MSPSNAFNNKKQNSTRSLEIGMVLKLYVSDTRPAKEKRFIVIGKTDNDLSIATLYINSKINKKINWAKELIDLHIHFKAQGREYLDYDSYVDCSKLIIRDFNELTAAINKRPEAILGTISDEDLQLISDKIKDSPTIKGKHKKKYGFYS